MVNLIVVNENAFGGIVKKGSVEDLEKYLFDPDLKFTGSGTRSFLRTARIPESFYKKHPEVLQKDLLTSMKSELRINEINFLEINKEIVYVSPSSDIEIIDPKEKFEELKNPIWKMRRRSYDTGIEQYVSIQDELARDEYMPSTYIEIPIMYFGKMKFETGLYKVVCSNGLLDKINANEMTLKTNQMSDTFFSPIASGIIQHSTANHEKYMEFLNYLRHCPIDAFEAKIILDQLTLEKVIPAPLTYKMMKYIDLIITGKEVEILLPKVIRNYYDVMDALTYYVQKLPSTALMTRVEFSVFTWLYNKYTTETNYSMPKLDIKSLAPRISGAAIESDRVEYIPNIDSLIPA